MRRRSRFAPMTAALTAVAARMAPVTPTTTTWPQSTEDMNVAVC